MSLPKLAPSSLPVPTNISRRSCRLLRIPRPCWNTACRGRCGEPKHYRPCDDLGYTTQLGNCVPCHMAVSSISTSVVNHATLVRPPSRLDEVGSSGDRCVLPMLRSSDCMESLEGRDGESTTKNHKSRSSSSFSARIIRPRQTSTIIRQRARKRQRSEKGI